MPRVSMTCACSSTSANGYGPAYWVKAGTSARFILEALAAPTAPGIDLTDAEPFLVVRESPSATTAKLECAIDDGLTWSDQAAGVLFWDIVPTDFPTSNGYVPGTPWYYEFGYELADGSIYIPDQGIGELYLDKVRPDCGVGGLQIAWSPFLRARAVSPDGTHTPTYASTAYVDAAIVAAFTRDDEANATGNTTITLPAGSRHHVVDLVFSGSAGTRVVIADTTGAIAGDVLRLNYTLPATASIVVELRNATAGGTLLDTLTTDTSAEPATLVATYSGTAWVLSNAQYPSN
jgi:hypothetical protein